MLWRTERNSLPDVLTAGPSSSVCETPVLTVSVSQS
jgi:hypothetical protein